ncbi:MAG: alpha/beta fold family hydrolase-like [Actinobacteria bacterium]|nr:MAG: alpha/beta fold family hydrolase-like [Actinomycetota bacterium]
MKVDDYIFDLRPDVTRKPVSYKNRYGITIAADLYLPRDFDESTSHAALVIGAPYGGVKEQGPGIYAQEMAARGFVALTFDPSFNGYSGGEPRYVTSPDIFVEDISAGVDFLGTRPFVDRERIGAIGMCGSGAFSLCAAQVDRRIKAVATTSMWDHHRFYHEGWEDCYTDEDRNKILDDLGEQRYVDFENPQPALTPRDAPFVDENTDDIGREFGEFYSAPRGSHHNALTQHTRTSVLSFMNFPLLAYVHTISPRPILIVVGEKAFSRYLGEGAFEKAAEPKELYIVPGAGHVDLYDKTDLIPFDKLEAFFKENLA